MEIIKTIVAFILWPSIPMLILWVMITVGQQYPLAIIFGCCLIALWVVEIWPRIFVPGWAD